MVRSARVLLAASVLAALSGLAVTTTHRLETQQAPFWETLKRRYWEDMHLAMGLYLHGGFPVSSGSILEYATPQGSRARETGRDIERLVEREGMAPWQFWRRVGTKRFLKRDDPVRLISRFDDAGRPVILGLAFHLLRGVAPYLLFWLGALCAAPVIVWAALELARAGHPVAGAVFPLLLGAWPFLAEALAVSYSPVGFHPLAVLLVVPLAAYASLHPKPTPQGLLVRAALAGVILAVCVLCRAGAVLTVPGFLMAAALGAHRAAPAGGPRRGARVALHVLAAAALLLLPYLAARSMVARLTAHTFEAHGEASPPPQQHAAWYGIWAGLGDFDRTHGYAWLDATVNEAIIANGGVPLRPGFYHPSNEALLKRLVLRDIADDPGWYAGILARRLASTVLQWKLRAFQAPHGYTITLSDHVNQGAQDAYFLMAATAEVFGVGGRRLELPLPVLWVPALLLIGLAAGERETRRALLVPACVGVAALPLPLFVTTAAGIETESFALVYLVAAALVADRAARSVRAFRAPSGEVAAQEVEQPLTGPEPAPRLGP